MDTCSDLCPSDAYDLNSAVLWTHLDSSILHQVKSLVYNAKVPIWVGQEIDATCDIVLSAIRKTCEYALNTQQNGISIASPEGLSVVIARNQFRDFRREDCRRLHVDRERTSSPSVEASCLARPLK